MNIIAFQPDMLEAAAKLLAARHTRERLLRPELPEAFEQPAAAQNAIQALLEKKPYLASAAIHDGELIGFLIGNLNFSEIRERHLWIDYAGSALAADASSELYRDLYAHLAESAVAQGYYKHYVLFPSGDEQGVNAWFRSGFGHEQAHALLTLPTDTSPVELPDVAIRLVDKSDEAVVRHVAPTIMQHQVRTPVFGIAFPGEASHLREGYAGLLDEEDVAFWLASRDSDPLGYQVFWPDEPSSSNMMIPHSCISLGVGATLPAARSMGIGTALVKRGFQHAHTQGFTYCSTDWRTTNLLSSRYWPKIGFQPIAYRMFRHIDPRIAWADGRNA